MPDRWRLQSTDTEFTAYANANIIAQLPNTALPRRSTQSLLEGLLFVERLG